MNAVAKASSAIHDSTEWNSLLSEEVPGKAYLLSMLLAIGAHVAVIFGWQGRSHFEPAEYGVVAGQSAIEVILIETAPETPRMEEGRIEEMLTPPEPVQTQEPTTEVLEQSEPEMVAFADETPVLNSVQEEATPESTPLPEPKPESIPELAMKSTRRPAAPKPVTSGDRKKPPAESPGRGRPGHEALASRSAGSHTSKAAYLHNPHPPYPEAARRAGQTGVVMLRVSINERGRVSAVSLTKSSGHSLLDERARSSVQGWTFRPARRDGKPVATQVDVPVRFSLDR